MQYDTNPKHSEPWQRGRRGTLCPKEIDLDVAQDLLAESVAEGKKRYAVREGKAYCAQEHESGLWHGYPVGWVAVPMSLRQKWKKERRVRRSDIRRFWD